MQRPSTALHTDLDSQRITSPRSSILSSPHQVSCLRRGGEPQRGERQPAAADWGDPVLALGRAPPPCEPGASPLAPALP